MKRYQEAVADFSKGIALSPKDEDLYLNRAKIYLYYLKDYAAAKDDYSKIISLNADCMEAYRGRADAYFFMDDLAGEKNDKATLRSLKAKLKVSPNNILIKNKKFAGTSGCLVILKIRQRKSQYNRLFFI